MPLPQGATTRRLTPPAGKSLYRLASLSRLDTTMDGVRDEETGNATTRNQVRQRTSIPSFLFITFLLFMLTSHNGDEFLARHQYQDALHNLQYELGNFTAWMNGTETNFTLPNQDPIIPPLLDDLYIQPGVLDDRYATYYPNITGFIHGSSVFHNITPPALAANETASWNPLLQKWMSDSNQTEIIESIQGWNWTASDKLAISVVEKFPTEVNGTVISEDMALVHGRIEFTDSNTSEDLRLEFEGIHFIANGTLYGLAQSPGHRIDIRQLPSIVPEVAKNQTARLIEPELGLRIKKLRTLIDDGVIDQDSNADLPKAECPFTLFAQLQPSPVSKQSMLELEEEIQRPTGIWTIEPPKLSINGVLLSKKCGIMYEIVDTEGLRSRTFFRKVTTYAGTAGLAYLALLILYSRQSEQSRTPSGLSRISRWSFLSQATMDSVSFAGHITFAILAEGRPSLSLVAPAFLACILFVHEAQFAVLIHQIQLPESVSPNANTQPPPSPRPSTATPPANSNVTTPSVPSPATAPTPTPTPNTSGAPTPPPQQGQQAATPTPPAAPAQLTPDQMTFWQFFVQHIRTDPQARLWIVLFVFLTLIVRVILSPLLSVIFVIVTYSLIWLPQILRSIRRGRSSGLSAEYVVGTTVCRLYLCLYFLACPKNVLDVEVRPWSYLLALSVIFQACVVMMQDTFGPAFFLPARYQTTKTYDYHPPLPLSDPHAAEQSVGDCSICMELIMVHNPNATRSEKDGHTGGEKDGEVDLESGGLTSSLRERGLGSARLLSAVTGNGRKNYSLAPCHHLFHTECLERWLAIKNICPQCRRPLPPL